MTSVLYLEHSLRRHLLAVASEEVVTGAQRVHATRMLLYIRGARRFLSESFRTSALAFPRYCPERTVRLQRSGFHRYEPVGTQGLLPGDAVVSTF